MVTQLLGGLGRNRRRTWRLMAALVVAGVIPAMGAACGGAAGVVVEPEGGAAIEAPTNAPGDEVAAGLGDGDLDGTPIAAPTDAPAATGAPPVLAAGETRQPAGEALAYPTEFTLGILLPDNDALDRIAPAGTAERQAFEAELAEMGHNAPSSERVFGLNMSEADSPSWTYLPGSDQALYVAVIQENGAIKIDPSLHDWRARNVTGVEFVEWQEVTPPPGADKLRLVANGKTTVIGAFKGDTLVYWFNTEGNNGQGDWLPNDSNMPEGAEGYSFDTDKNTWVTQIGETVFEYRSGNWNEVIELGEVRDNLWWDGEGWQELPAMADEVTLSIEGEEIKAFDGTTSMYWMDGQWWTEAQWDTQKMVEYVEENATRINYKEMTGIEIRASSTLQREMWEQLPEDLQAKGENPLFVIVTSEEVLRKAIGEQFVKIAGKDGLTSLQGRDVRITYLSASEDQTRTLPVFGGTGQSTFAGAFERSDGVIEIVIGLPPYLSTLYRYNRFELEADMQPQLTFVFSLLVGNHTYSKAIEADFVHDTSWDDYFQGNSVGHTYLLWFINAGFRYDVPRLQASGFLKDLGDQIPSNYR